MGETVLGYLVALSVGGIIVEIVRALFQRKRMGGEYVEKLAQAASTLVEPLAKQVTDLRASLREAEHSERGLRASLQEAREEIEDLKEDLRDTRVQLADAQSEVQDLREALASVMSGRDQEPDHGV